MGGCRRCMFYDPWWKPQHFVKRLFSPPFVDLLAAKLQAGGLLHFKSDVEEYWDLVRYLVEGHGDFSPHNPALADRIGPYAQHIAKHGASANNVLSLPIILCADKWLL